MREKEREKISTFQYIYRERKRGGGRDELLFASMCMNSNLTVCERRKLLLY